MKTFVRNFKKRKSLYLITLVGFGTALAVFVIISSFIIEEKSYDKHLPHIKKMYRAKYKDNAGIPQQYYRRLTDNIPEIEKLGMYDKNGFGFKYKNKPYFAQYLGINLECIELFEIKFIYGNQELLLKAKLGVAVTESYSKKLFKNKNPIGEEIIVNNEKRKVIAVVNDPLKTFSLQYDFLWHNEYNTGMSLWCYGQYPKDCYHILETAIVINDKMDVKIVEEKINDELNDCRIYKEDKIFLQQYEDIYFDTSAGFDGHEKANIQIIKLLSFVAIIVLILAILNYINLATATNNERFKEVCIRKISGSHRRSIVFQFIKESYITCLLSLVFGMVLLVIFGAVFNDIFGKEFNVFNSFRHTGIVLILPSLVLFIGGISGLIPAIATSYYKPIELVQRKNKLKRSGTRDIFIIFQFIVATCLIVCLILVNKQLNYVKTKDFGFKKEFLLTFRLGHLDNYIAAIRNEISKNPNVLQSCASEGRPFNIIISGTETIYEKNRKYNSGGMKMIKTDWNFLNTFDIPLIHGRDFRQTDKNVCLINEKFFKEMNIKSIENIIIGDSKLIGVFKDIHYEKLYNKIGKLQVKLTPNNSDLDEITVRINSDNIDETIHYLESTMKSIDPYFKMYYEFYDEYINHLYKQEEKQSQTLKIFALLSIFLACLGLYGMVEFNCKQRTKEIGVRKVNGAITKEIMALLNKDIIMLVAIAFIIASPLSWSIMKIWLDNFAYRTEISWWIFILAGAIIMIIALITVSWQSWKAANRNLVKALRYE